MKTILVPSDFSKNATNALRYAIRLSMLTKSELVVFHCANIAPYILAAAAGAEEQVAKLIQEDESYKRKKLIAQVGKAYQYLGFKNIPAKTKIIVETNPLVVENIVGLAKKCHADLIITGTHGATGLNRFFFGTNSANLISKSAIPVLAIPGKCRYTKITNIAYASDLEHVDEELKRLIPFAKALKAGIDVLYMNYGTGTKELYINNAQSAIVKAGYNKIKLVKRSATIEYSLIGQLKKYLSKHSQQWLVMFTKERGFWEKLVYGGKTEYMSYSIKIPLLSFKKNIS